MLGCLGLSWNRKGRVNAGLFFFLVCLLGILVWFEYGFITKEDYRTRVMAKHGLSPNGPWHDAELTPEARGSIQMLSNDLADHFFLLVGLILTPIWLFVTLLLDSVLRWLGRVLRGFLAK